MSTLQYLLTRLRVFLSCVPDGIINFRNWQRHFIYAHYTVFERVLVRMLQRTIFQGTCSHTLCKKYSLKSSNA